MEFSKFTFHVPWSFSLDFPSFYLCAMSYSFQDPLFLAGIVAFDLLTLSRDPTFLTIVPTLFPIRPIKKFFSSLIFKYNFFEFQKKISLFENKSFLNYIFYTKMIKWHFCFWKIEKKLLYPKFFSNSSILFLPMMCKFSVQVILFLTVFHFQSRLLVTVLKTKNNPSSQSFSSLMNFPTYIAYSLSNAIWFPLERTNHALYLQWVDLIALKQFPAWFFM